MGNIFYFIIIFNLFSNAGDLSINVVRSLYQKASKEEKYCDEIIRVIKEHNVRNHPLFLGYMGSATMMKAKYAGNVFYKLSHFNKGRNMLEQALNQNEDNIELRFLRLAAQANTPSFLGYKSKISSDKSFLLNSISKVTDSVLKNNIVSYLINSGLLTENQKNQLRKQPI
jgi:hypothetical protein